MASSSSAQLTDFSLDILGRYLCNGFDEAMHSTDKNAQRPDGSPQSDARPFNAIIIGGGSFGGILAQHLLYADVTNSFRILVLEAGRHSLPEHFQNLPLQRQPMECGDFLGSATLPMHTRVSPTRLAAVRFSLAVGHRGCLTKRCLQAGGRPMWWLN